MRAALHTAAFTIAAAGALGLEAIARAVGS